MVISSNFTNCKVTRKGADCNWLKSILMKTNVGWFVPPLSEERELSKADKKGIQARVDEIFHFLNSLIKYPPFLSSKYFKAFLEQ